VAKSIILKLSSSIIADFQSCFDTKQKEREYLYQNITAKINENIGDVFIKKQLNVRVIENGQQIQKKTTLDEINFEKTDIPSNHSWESKDIEGKIEPYEYMVGDSFWNKIYNWSKLNHIINRKFNESLIDHNQKMLSKSISKGKTSEEQIKTQQENLNKSQKELKKSMNDECLESYTHLLFTGVIFEKIKSSEQELLDKEFAELNK